MNHMTKKLYQSFAIAILCVTAVTSTAFAAGADATFNTVINLISKFVLIGGGLWTVWGAVVLGGALKDHNGPQMQSGIWQMVGGAVIIGAAGLFKTII